MRWCAPVLAALVVRGLFSSALAMPPVDDGPAGRIEGGPGDGFVVTTPDELLRFQVRARAQLRGVLEVPDEGEAEVGFLARRIRLALRTDAPKWNLGLYLQLGFAPGDLDPAAPNIIRDAVVTWRPSKRFRLHFGQTKAPFNRERVISSSALSFVDRSPVNGEFNLDRDIGLQFLFDRVDEAGHLALQLAVFGGDGRNVTNTDTGLLYTFRAEYRLDPSQDVYSEADLREDTSKHAFAAAIGAGFNHRARRTRSTIGSFLPGDARFDIVHGQADFIWKYRGWSIQSEVLLRVATRELTSWTDDEGVAQEVGFRSGFGWFVNVGRAFTPELFMGLRYSEIHPLGDRSLVDTERTAQLTGGWFLAEHALKVQADYGYVFGDDLAVGDHIVRVQTQVFF
jgi:phosphate-selective porin OprO/OprP